MWFLMNFKIGLKKKPDDPHHPSITQNKTIPARVLLSVSSGGMCQKQRVSKYSWYHDMYKDYFQRSPNPIASMGLVYLPTFGWFFMVNEYTIHGSYCMGIALRKTLACEKRGITGITTCLYLASTVTVGRFLVLSPNLQLWIVKVDRVPFIYPLLQGLGNLQSMHSYDIQIYTVWLIDWSPELVGFCSQQNSSAIL